MVLYFVASVLPLDNLVRVYVFGIVIRGFFYSVFLHRSEKSFMMDLYLWSGYHAVYSATI